MCRIKLENEDIDIFEYIGKQYLIRVLINNNCMKESVVICYSSILDTKYY